MTDKNIPKKSKRVKNTSKKLEKIGIEPIWVRTEYGELVKQEQFLYTKIVERDANFMKMWIKSFLEQAIQPFMAEKTFEILSFLILNADKDNCIIETIKTIAKKCETTEFTVQRTLAKLIETGFLIKVRNGVYQINTDTLWRGTHSSRQAAKEKFTKKPKKIK